MAKIFGQLEKASLENLSSNPSAGTTGRFWWNTTDLKVYSDDGTLIRAFLRNDGKAIVGNSGTANDNIRLHRGAAGVLQFVQGGDATAEGSLSANLNSLSFKFESYTFAGRPANGSAGRVIWVSDRSALQVDTGAAWAGIGSGGGSGALHWVEAESAPIASIEYQQQVYLYDVQEGQDLFALVKVPSSYVAGSQISMKMAFYSPDNTGTAHLKTEATLIRPATDVMTTTTNQRVSTNGAVTLGVGTVDIPQNVTFDLTDTSGQINGVAVSPGDLVKIKLYRNSSTGASELRALVYGAEVLFS